MKAPVGLLSDRTVCVSRWRGFAPTSSMQVSVEDKIRNHRLTDISHNMIPGGREQEDVSMKYDERACKFNMDTGCVELLLRDGRKISIDCTGVEDALDVTMAQRSELNYLIYNDPLGYADLILNGDPEEYLKNMAGSHGLES